RSKRDWSSDVCSSDLEETGSNRTARIDQRHLQLFFIRKKFERSEKRRPLRRFYGLVEPPNRVNQPRRGNIAVVDSAKLTRCRLRSEERRVGKEGGAWG